MTQQRLEDKPTAELIKDALADARELVRIEVGLAKVEVQTELKAASRAAIAAGVALVAFLLALSMAAVALVLALGGTAWIALAVSGGFLLTAGLASLIAYRRFPKKPLVDTRKRIEGDIQELKEHIA